MSPVAAARRAVARAAPAPSPRPTPARRREVARPARRTRTPRRTPLPARIVPMAVARPAAAISGIADTGLFVRLTRGRLWIGLLTALLVGIVAVNVLSLSFGATASRLGREADGIQRANSAMRARLAGELSDLSVQRAALRSGLVYPPAGSIRYLKPRPGDAAIAARRLVHGDLVAGTAPTTPTSTAPTTVTTPTTAAPTTVTTTTATVPTTTGVGAP